MRAVLALGFWRALGGIKGAKAGRRATLAQAPAVALVTSAVGAPDPAWRRSLPPGPCFQRNPSPSNERIASSVRYRADHRYGAQYRRALSCDQSTKTRMEGQRASRLRSPRRCIGRCGRLVKLRPVAFETVNAAHLPWLRAKIRDEEGAMEMARSVPKGSGRRPFGAMGTGADSRDCAAPRQMTS